MIDRALAPDATALAIGAIICLAFGWGIGLCVDGIVRYRRAARRMRDEMEAIRILLEPSPPCDVAEHRRRLEHADHDHTN